MIGVAKPKGSVFGQSQDNYVGIPDQTYFKIYGDRAGMQLQLRRAWTATIWKRPRTRSAR